MRYINWNRCRIPGALAALALAVAVAASVVIAIPDGFTARGGEAGVSPASSPAAGPVCDLRHPIEVAVRAGRPERGKPLTANVKVEPGQDLDDVTITLISSGGAQPLAATERRLGALSRGRAAEAAFSVRVPASGHRFLLQFLVKGEGPNGPLSRIATFNVLPDGPADPGRVIATADGTGIREFAARRIER